MYLGDNLLKDGITDLVETFKRNEPDALILLTPVPDPEHYGVAELENDRVKRLVEKPKDPPSDLALVGVYMFTPVIFDAARSIEPSWRDELEITDAIQRLIDDGHVVRHEILQGWWIDTGKKDPLLESNRLVLETLEARCEGSVDETSRVEGRVVIEAGAELVNSTVRGPAAIGAGTRVVNSFIGPFTSVAADCEIVDSEVEHSVLLEHSRVVAVPRLTDSLIGRHVEVMRSGATPVATRLLVGDHSRVELA
jgi:glucose-1-phosphate thymidylyltransferase